MYGAGLLDAFFAMISQVDGDSTPLAQRLVCVCCRSFIGCGPLLG